MKECIYFLENIKYLKESDPVQTIDYVVAKEIDHESELNWWVGAVQKNCQRINNLFNQHNYCYLKNTHKFGIKLSKTVEESCDLDRRNGDNLWEIVLPRR